MSMGTKKCQAEIQVDINVRSLVGADRELISSMDGTMWYPAARHSTLHHSRRCVASLQHRASVAVAG